MMNELRAYSLSGKRAATALNQRDQSRYRFERDWFTQAIRLEHEGADRQAAIDAYNDAFKATRHRIVAL